MALWRSTKLALVLVVGLFIVLWIGGLLMRRARPVTDTRSAVPQEASVTVIQTMKGSFTVPGKAFADGRDLEARPSLTVMEINVWDAVPRSRKVCEVRHGVELTVTDAKRSEPEERYYFKIRAADCEGWLPETFLSPKREAIVGRRP